MYNSKKKVKYLCFLYFEKKYIKKKKTGNNALKLNDKSSYFKNSKTIQLKPEIKLKAVNIFEIFSFII